MVKVSGETSKHRCGGKMTKKYRQAGGFTPEQCAQKCAEDDQCQYVSLAQNKYCNVCAWAASEHGRSKPGVHLLVPSICCIINQMMVKSVALSLISIKMV